MTTVNRQERARRFALTVWSVIGVLVLMWVSWRLADLIRIIWLPLAFAGGLTMLLNPIVNSLERARIPRVVGTVFAFLVAAGVVTLTVVLLVPPIRQQGTDFAAELPKLWDGVVDWLHVTSDRFGVDLGPVWTSEIIREWVQNPDNQATIQELLGGFGSGAGRILRGVTETLAVAVLAPVLAFYMLMDSTKFKQRTRDLLPPSHREEAVYIGGELVSALSSFVRGQLLVAFFVGLFSSIGLYVLDLPFWLIIGIIAGLLNLVPFVGPFVGGALAAIVGLLNGSMSQALWAVGIFTVIQQVDNHIITPLVQRTRVHLSPLVIVLSLIIGGSLAGLLGVVVAVPAAAAIRILVGHMWRTRVLGESWQEASEAMIERTERPEKIVGVRTRRAPEDQQRLFDTAETPQLTSEEMAKQAARADSD